MNHASQATCASTTGVGAAGVATTDTKLEVQHDANWLDWYAAYLAAEHAGEERPQ